MLLHVVDTIIGDADESPVCERRSIQCQFLLFAFRQAKTMTQVDDSRSEGICGLFIIPSNKRFSVAPSLAESTSLST